MTINQVLKLLKQAEKEHSNDYDLLYKLTKNLDDIKILIISVPKSLG